MRYFIAAEFILETLCVLSLFAFGLGSSITAKKSLRFVSAFLCLISLALILSGVYDAFVILLTFLCILPLYKNCLLYYVSWFMVYNFGFNFISMIFQIAVYVFSRKFYLSDPSVLPLYAVMDDIILAGLIVLFFASRKTNTKRKETLKMMRKKEYVLLLCIGLFGYIMLMACFSLLAAAFFSYSLNEKGKIFFSITLFVLILLSIMIFYLLYSILRKNIALQKINKLNAENMALEEKYYQTLYHKNHDLRAFRHDFQNHVLALNTLVQEENWEELQQYLSALTATKERIFFFYTNSAIADAIVNEFYQALPSDISFHVEGQFPNNMWIANMDISIILSNLLKNAREACELLKEEAEKEIILEIQYRDRQLYIRTENSSRVYSPDEIMHIETTKKDALNHGFGLQNVFDSVQRYSGTMEIQYQNGYFMVMLILEKGQSAVKG